MESAESVNTAVLDLIKAGKRRAARHMLKEGLQRWPKSARLLLCKGEVLAAAVGRDEAAVHYAGLTKDAAIAPWAAVRLAALLAEGPVTLETALAVAPAVCALTDDAKKSAVLDRLMGGRDPEAQRRLLEAFAPVCGVFRYEWRHAVDLAGRGKMYAAASVLMAARTQGRTSAQATLLTAELLTLQWRMTEAVNIIRAALAEHETNPDFCRRAIGLLQRGGALAAAAALTERALERWPRDWMLLFRLNRQPVEPKQLKRIFAAIAARVPPAAEQDDRFRFQYALVRLHAGDVAHGRELLAAPFEAPTSELALPVRKALAARSDDEWLAAPRFADDRTLEVQVARSPGALATVMLTTGISFGNLPLRLVDRLFADHRLNVIYLRDLRKRAYLRGVGSLADTEAGTIAALKGMLAELGAPRTIAMGSSSGGFSALRYGALLEADEAVSFSGPTDLTSVYEGARPVIWNPNYFIQAIIERETDLPRDLVPVIAGSRRTRFTQYFGAEAEGDERQARRLEGLERVELIPVPGVSDHFVVDHMIGDGSFDALLGRLAKG